MNKFYYRFQWVGLFLFPFILTLGPSLLGITQWETRAFPIIAGVILFGLLLAVAILTTQTGKLNSQKRLSNRISALLESTYVSIVAILLTAGSANADNSNSPLVSVLLDRGIRETNAWFANDIAKTTLFLLVFVFLVTMLVSATRERIEFTRHRTVSRYEMLPFLEEDKMSEEEAEVTPEEHAEGDDSTHGEERPM